MPHLIKRARSSPANPLLTVLCDAVRAAALAPSDREALDITGAALAHAVSIMKSNSNRQSEAAIELYSLDCRR